MSIFLSKVYQPNSTTKIITTIKSITAKQFFKIHPLVKTLLWRRSLLASGFDTNTVGQYSNLETIQKYVQH